MLDRVRSKWNRWVWGTRFQAVHLHLLEGEQVSVTGLVLERKKDEIIISDSFPTGNSLEELKRFVQKDVPTALVITGKGVISKRLPRTKGGEQEQVKQMLAEYGSTPVFHAVSIQENWIHISVLRSEVLQDLLQELEEQSINPVQIQVGVPAIWDVLRFTESADAEVYTGIYRVGYDALGVASMELDDHPSEKYSVVGDAVDGMYLIPYAAILSMLSAAEKGVPPPKETSGQWEAVYYGSAFKKVGMAGVGVLFVLLLTNTLLFTHFHERKLELETAMVEYRGKLDEVESLKKELERKKHVASVSGTGTNGKFAYYADRLGATVPSAIRLTRMTLNPIMKRDRLGERMEVRSNLVEIEGVCKESEELNGWMRTLDTLDVVKELQIEGFEKKEGNDRNEFELAIKLDD
ncbi:MAG: hypothetical protein GC178_01805 [Flavobacteriales bacterium]|nr:hypothetical protein [Flavobacteriales bacterium]